MQDVRKKLAKIAALVRAETTLALATTGEDSAAAVAPLFYIADEELRFYWLSSPHSLHSRNLAERPPASATIFRSVESWRQIRGVQMRGRAEIVGDPERRAALLQAYAERFKLGRAFRLLVRQSALYVFEPEFIRYIDNAKGLGSGFELTRGPQGWSRTQGKD